ncbi:DNA circularization protein [Edwardsiella piscicida]|uniref:DNA circularization protein n=1 Tax=Edwardsiella piscicida TaxID=1263550 RepID=UPI00101ABDF0|nr:DNA circularization N-terminal domain-containing protein [Edwardsiella piscicida]ELM3734796.1 DNA circularization N-terminal domain-containing protein [Edwardsiella piscicida]QBB14242.1 multidrug DMT transporter [Edwardsiella piscicida]WGS78514.1 DNA circularization N-terminal domain-containing protein [Edwardsiella piscicida]WGS81899.1 DNA circularization N-terminal domain-containing protein [Edwardsiella piscicida]
MAIGKWEPLREASFRNVTFFLVEDEGTSGRRAIPRAYPKKNVGWTEDNGAVLTQQQINGKLLGKNFQKQLEALLQALNTPGPGEMVHPWFGIQKVQVGKVTHRLSTEEGGIAYISFEVFEAGERLFPAPKENTSVATLSAADAVKDAFANGDYFAALDGLGEMTDTLLDDMQGLVMNLPTLPSALSDWVDRAGRFKDLAGIVIAKPGELARQVTNLTSSIRDIVSEPPWSLRVYDQLRNQWSGDRAASAATKTLPADMSVTTSSPAQGVRGMVSSVTDIAITPTVAMQTNITDFRQLVIVSAVVAQAEAVATMDFTTSDEATAAGDTLARLLSDQAIAAVERGQRELWRTLRDLRFAVVNDVRVRGAKLPNIRRLNTSVTTTAALLAWRETGDTENRDEIVAWNRLRDPAFILPTMPIEVIE